MRRTQLTAFATMTYQKSLSFLLFSFLIIFLQSGEASEPKNNGNVSNEPRPPDNIAELSSEPLSADTSGVYIVYMGSAAPPENRMNYNLLMNSLLRNNIAIEQSYSRGLLGFAARMSDAEAQKLAEHPGVVSVFQDSMLKLHTTRSWDFLSDEMPSLTDSLPRFSTVSSSQGSNTVIGILDTGIWPESESFDDKSMRAIPSKWKGACMQGVDFNSSMCNRKIIGARFYGREAISPRDDYGHGTHVASTAAGVDVLNASYYGLAPGTAKGGSPAAHIAMYKVCTDGFCSTSSVLAAFDDAIGDGVDILSLSLGYYDFPPTDFLYDTIAIGAFHAVQSGITVVCSAGNSGPHISSVINAAPWILTVAATTIDRDLVSSIVLGNNKVIKGGSLNFSTLKKIPTIPLLFGGTAGTRIKDEPRYCYHPGKAEAQKINGSIVVCKLSGTDISTLEGVLSAGPAGLIIINDPRRVEPIRSYTFPLTLVTSKEGSEILSYINSTWNPVATILATETVQNFKPAPTVVYFSSRGPTYHKTNIIKPDIAAPGVSILAAWRHNDSDVTPPGKKPPKFNIASGTSMSTPHVSGIAATIKSLHPNWSPAAIRSAIMTTAIQTNNVGGLITTESGEAATPHDFGAGQVSRTGGLQPGLVYDMGSEDYLLFLCYYGYPLSKIKVISADLPKGFSCPKNTSIDMISNLNYPSIFISKNVAASPVTVTRTVTNVDPADKEAVYTIMVEAPIVLRVSVTPEELRFNGTTNKLSYQITFASSPFYPVIGDLFGAVIWANEKYNVRIPFVVSSN